MNLFLEWLDEPLVHRLGPDGIVPMRDDQRGHLAARNREREDRRLDARTQQFDRLFLHHAIARSDDEALTVENPIGKLGVRAVCDDEIGIQEDEVGSRHGLAEVGEASQKRMRQRDAVPWRQQVVDRYQTRTAVFEQPPHHRC